MQKENVENKLIPSEKESNTCVFFQGYDPDNVKFEAKKLFWMAQQLLLKMGQIAMEKLEAKSDEKLITTVQKVSKTIIGSMKQLADFFKAEVEVEGAVETEQMVFHKAMQASLFDKVFPGVDPTKLQKAGQY